MNDIPDCVAMEKLLSESQPTAATEGFLLSGGSTPEGYQAAIAEGSVCVAEAQGHFVGFCMLLAPQNQHLQTVLAKRHRFQLDGVTDIFDGRQLAWIAKVAVSPAYRRCGIGTSFYRWQFAHFSSTHFATTTVAAPLFNEVSHRFHAAMKFLPIGTVYLGDRGTLKEVRCTLWYKPPQASVGLNDECI